MKFTPLLALFLIASCDQQAKTDQHPASQAPPVSFQITSFSWKENEFTQWMSRAELQILQDNAPSGTYFARVEGRNNLGRLEYRAVQRPFPSPQFQQWAVFWGIGEEELFNWELRLLKSGFERKEMQAFADPAGKPLYQIVWLKAAGTGEQTDSDSQLAAAETSPAPPPPSVPLTEPETQSEPAPRETPPAAIVVRDETAETGARETTSTDKPSTEKASPDKAEARKFYVIQPGDTLGKIAKRRGVTVKALKAANHLESDVLRVGRKLVIP